MLKVCNARCTTQTMPRVETYMLDTDPHGLFELLQLAVFVVVAGTASDPVSACGGFGRSQDQVLRPMAEKGQGPTNLRLPADKLFEG